jgi:hypothetical protein
MDPLVFRQVIGNFASGVTVITAREQDTALAPILPQIGVLPSFLLIGGFLIVAAILAQFGVNTRGKELEDVSP